MSPAPTPAQNRRGILAMVASMAIFTANDTFTKLARVDLPVGEVLFIRGIFAGLVSLALVVAFGKFAQYLWPAGLVKTADPRNTIWLVDGPASPL